MPGGDRQRVGQSVGFNARSGWTSLLFILPRGHEHVARRTIARGRAGCGQNGSSRAVESRRDHAPPGRWPSILLAVRDSLSALCSRGGSFRLHEFCPSPNPWPSFGTRSSIARPYGNRVRRRHLPAARLCDPRRQRLHGSDLFGRASGASGAGDLVGGIEVCGRACQRIRSPCDRRSDVRFVPPSEARAGLGRGCHCNTLRQPVFLNFSATADERSACDDLGACHALRRDAQPRACLLGHYVRSCVWHRSAHAPHECATGISDIGCTGIQCAATGGDRAWCFALRPASTLLELSTFRFASDHRLWQPDPNTGCCSCRHNTTLQHCLRAPSPYELCVLDHALYGPPRPMRPGAALCSARSYPRLGHAGSMDSGTHRILCLLPTFWQVMGLYSFSPSLSPAISHACQPAASPAFGCIWKELIGRR